MGEMVWGWWLLGWEGGGKIGQNPNLCVPAIPSHRGGDASGRRGWLRQRGSARMTAVAAATMWEPASDGQPAPLDLDLKLGELKINGCDRAPREG